MIIALPSQFHNYLPWVHTHLALCLNSVLNVKALSTVIVKTSPMVRLKLLLLSKWSDLSSPAHAGGPPAPRLHTVQDSGQPRILLASLPRPGPLHDLGSVIFYYIVLIVILHNSRTDGHHHLPISPCLATLLFVLAQNCLPETIVRTMNKML